MSMLVGVRGQTGESEGASLREGIIQQPGPFYNGNPSSMIWGNSPTTPLWREETVSPFPATASSGFGISKQRQQHMQTEALEKGSAGGVMTGEGRASSKGRRHVTRAQVARHPNPHPNPSPSSPFAFGFPPQPPQPDPPSSSAPGFGPPRVPTGVASGSSFVAFASGINFAPGAFGTGVADAAGFRTGLIPSVQDERMEDIEEVIPAMAHMTVNDNPRDSKFAAAKADELTTRSGLAAQDEPLSWATESQVSVKFSALGLNGPTEPSMDPRRDTAAAAAAAPGVFVFGAKPASNKEATADVPKNTPQSIFQQPPPAARSRPVKVKRSAPAFKGKGIAAGNGAFTAQEPSLVGLPVEGSSDSSSGECSFSQLPPPGLDIPPVDNAECTRDDASPQGFVASSLPMPAQPQEDSAWEGAHQSSSRTQSPSRSGHHPNFVFGEIAKGSNFSGESSARSELSTVAETLLKASKMGNDISLSSAFSRVTSSRKGSILDDDAHGSSRSALKASSAGFSDNATSKNVSSGKPKFSSGDLDAKNRLQVDEDLSADLALKLGLEGSRSADGTATGTKSGKALVSTTAVAAAGSSQKGVPAAPKVFPRDSKTGVAEGGNQDGGDNLHSSSSSPTNTVEFSGGFPTVAASVDAQQQIPTAFLSFAQVHQSEPDAIHAHREPFVFGASRPQQPTRSPSPVFKFRTTSTASSSSPSSSSTGRGEGSRSAGISASDPLAFKHKGAGANDNSSLPSQQPRTDAEALPSSFTSFNLGAAKIPVKGDGASKPEGILPPATKQQAMPTPPVPPFASGSNVKEDSDDNSSYVTAASRFVFSVGSGSTSTSPSKAAAPPKRASAAASAEQKFKENSFPTDSNVTSEFFEAQSWSQPRNESSKPFEFEFHANNGIGGAVGGNNATARKKVNRTRSSVPKRQSRSTATSKEKKISDTFTNFVDMSGTAEEAGSPMDFSPQRYTPPDDTYDTGQTLKHKAWGNIPSVEKAGLGGDDEWAQFSETDVAMENLRNAANDLTLGGKQEGRSTWEGIGKGEDESFWWGGKENSPRKTGGRSGKWKRAVFNENQVPLSGKDNTWADVNVNTGNEPDTAATSSIPSADSSSSSSGWGHFTFTAGSSPKLSSTTSFLRRHSRRIQRDRPVHGSTEGSKTASWKAQSESTPSAHAGVNVGVEGNASAAAAGGSTTMKPTVYTYDSPGNPPAEAGKEINGRGSNWDQFKVPSVMFPSRPNSWSNESSMGSLPKSDGVRAMSPQTAGAAATEQVCERWRLRGNQAYANGDFPKAEEYYSRGASSVPPNETSQSCIRASMLCYSNRAATRMVVGRMREALADCMRAMAVDPNFLRVRLRAASCHLALGETEAAALAFKECIRRSKEDDQPDVKVSSEAAEGLRKALQVDEYLDRACEILANWSSGDTLTALRLLNEALLSSPHSERALELKARALLILRRYEEVVQLCEQSLVTAERNHPLASGDPSIYQLLQAASGGDSAKGATSPLKMWRWQVTAKAKFHLGRLEETLEMLQNLDEIASTVTTDTASSAGTSPGSDPSSLSIATIRDLLRHKAAGNDAFQNGKHAEAVEHYSAALACNGDSCPFSAVCFCNRAAASQALGNIGDAIADCSRAIALDPKYAKAISRRATLHEKVRDYDQSCHDLQRLITLLESQQQQSRATMSLSRAGRSANNTQQDLRQAHDRLAKTEDEMKKGHPLDHYMILGLEAGCTSNEIKKAYRKAALRHHPDKAGQFLARSEGGDDGGMWKEVADEVRRDAERLFKLIGEANAILSDPQKRTRYDAEEEFRKLRTRTSSTTGGFSEMYRSAERGQGGAGRRPRDRYDSWNGYSHQHQRWQSGPDAAQPDTYARRGRYGSNSSSRSNGDGGRWNDYDWDDM